MALYQLMGAAPQKPGLFLARPFENSLLIAERAREQAAQVFQPQERSLGIFLRKGEANLKINLLDKAIIYLIQPLDFRQGGFSLQES